jgi:hypothetical protein
MQQGKKKLNVVQNDSRIIEGTTCFSAHAERGVNCQRQSCKQWINRSEDHNCVLIAAQKGPHTLQNIGQIYGLTRMRICQIEKGILEKIRRITQ